MIKHIVHIADIHIRNTQYHDMYCRQFAKFYKELSNFNYQLEETRIVIAGDIFHQKINISNEQLILASQFITELSKFGKVIIIPGNHDFLENNTDRIDSITPIINLLQTDKISYYRKGGVYEDENINWVVYSLYEHNKRPDFEKTKNKKHIGIFHGPIQGSTTDTGYVFETGYDKLNFRDLDIVLCGDIHKRTVIKLQKIDIIYPSSLIQQNFGETIKKHGFGVYDVEKNKYNFYDIENESSFLHFKITNIKDIENNEEELLNFE